MGSYAQSLWKWGMCVNFLQLFWTRNLSILPNLLIIYVLVNVYFIVWVIIQHLFCCLNYIALAIGRSFSCLLCLVDVFLSLWGFGVFVSNFFLSDIAKCSRFILNISCPSPGMSHFFKEPWFLWLQHSIRNQGLCAR